MWETFRVKVKRLFIILVLALSVAAIVVVAQVRKKAKIRRACEQLNSEMLTLKRKMIELQKELASATDVLPDDSGLFDLPLNRIRTVKTVNTADTEGLSESRGNIAEFVRRAIAAKREMDEKITNLQSQSAFDFETLDQIDEILEEHTLHSAPDLKLGRPSPYSIGELFRTPGGAQVYIDALNEDIRAIDEITAIDAERTNVDRRVQAINSSIGIVKKKRAERLEKIVGMGQHDVCVSIDRSRQKAEATLDAVRQISEDPVINRGAKVAIPEYERIVRNNKCKDVDTVSATLWGGSGIFGPGDHRVPIRNIFIDRVREYSARIKELYDMYDIQVVKGELCDRVAGEAKSIAYIVECTGVSGWEKLALAKMARDCVDSTE